MASQGPLSAGTGTTSGSPAWSNPDRIVASDNSRTTINNLASLATTGTLISSQHGFSIPDGATIDGILVEIERHGTSGASDGIEDSSIRLATGGSAVGDNKATTATWPTVGAETYATYGGSADTWGRSWTAAEINASTFGVQLVAVNADAATRDARVDHVQITVYYTEAGGGAVEHLLTASATQAQSATSGLLATRRLAATSTQAQSAASAITATHRLTASASQEQAASSALTLTGVETITASASQTQAATSTLTATLRLAASATQAQAASSALTLVEAGGVTHQIAASATQGQAAVSSLTARKRLRLAAFQAQAATALLTGTWRLAASASQTQAATASLSVRGPRSPRVVALTGSDRASPALVGTDRQVTLQGSITDG